MNAKSFVELRKKCGLTQADVAQRLGVTPRTIAGWEASQKSHRSFSGPETRAITDLFLDLVLQRPLQAWAESAFQKLPSELVSIWIVRNQQCVLLPKTARFQNFGDEKDPDSPLPGALLVLPLVNLGLTTTPLRSGELMNLAGDDIQFNPNKKDKTSRAAFYLWNGIVESLLHVPAFVPTAAGPLPVLLLSFQNKLDAAGRVIVASTRKDPQDEVPKIYTPAEVEVARGLALKIRDGLLIDLCLLEIVPG
jgi:transcriptional regulator with XRE-family HTH domain